MKEQYIYLDDNNNIVDYNNCSKMIIRELDDNGKLVKEVYLNKNDYNNINNNELIEITEEEYKFLKELNPNYDPNRICYIKK